MSYDNNVRWIFDLGSGELIPDLCDPEGFGMRLTCCKGPDPVDHLHSP